MRRKRIAKDNVRTAMTCALLAGCMAAAVSCSSDGGVYDENFAQRQKDEQYANAFIAKYGQIDSRQTWNTVKKYAVMVNAAGADSVEVYSAHPCNASAVRYTWGKVGETLLFDAPDGLDSVVVAAVDADGAYTYRTVDMKGSDVHTIDMGNVGGQKAKGRVTRAAYNEDDQSYTFTKEELMEINTEFPENGDASQLLNDYEFISTGPMRLYPILAATGGADEIGYYYYTNDITKRKEVKLISNIQTFNSNCEQVALVYADGTKTTQNFGFASDHRLSWLQSDFTGLETKGFLIDAPVGSRVGLYVKNTSRFKAYTNTNINAANKKGVKYYSAVKEVNGRYLVGLEDWKEESDCNDIVFYIDPRPVIVPTKPAESKVTLAFEDLGAVGDYDFNDVVIEVSKFSEDNHYLKVDLVAAGGTLPFQLKFNGQTLFDKKADKIGDYANTRVYNTDSIIKTAYVAMPSGFTLSQSTCTSMFKLYVAQKGSDTMLENALLVSTNTESGKAPQVLVIPEKWNFPMENQNISDKYPKFTDYVHDNTVVGWYK